MFFAFLFTPPPPKKKFFKGQHILNTLKPSFDQYSTSLSNRLISLSGHTDRKEIKDEINFILFSGPRLRKVKKTDSCDSGGDGVLGGGRREERSSGVNKTDTDLSGWY